MNKGKPSPSKKENWGGEWLDSLAFNELDLLNEPVEQVQKRMENKSETVKQNQSRQNRSKQNQSKQIQSKQIQSKQIQNKKK